MDLQRLLQINPNELAIEQHNALNIFVVNRLRKVADLVEKGKYNDVLNMLEYSSAGDGYGSENHYIDFSDSGAGDDLEQMIANLQRLKKTSEG